MEHYDSVIQQQFHKLFLYFDKPANDFLIFLQLLHKCIELMSKLSSLYYFFMESFLLYVELVDLCFLYLNASLDYPLLSHNIK